VKNPFRIHTAKIVEPFDRFCSAKVKMIKDDIVARVCNLRRKDGKSEEKSESLDLSISFVGCHILAKNCTKQVANIIKTTHLRPFSCIFLGYLKKKKYLCGRSNEQIIKMV